MAMEGPGMQPGEDGFEAPPAESVKTPDDSNEQAAAFTAPSNMERVAEEAQAIPESPGFASVPPQLLEVKQSIEQQLEHRAVQGLAIQSAEGLAGSDNIQGVAIGLADAARGRTQATEPGLPTLTLFTAEPTTPDEAQSAVVESFGVEDVARNDVPVSVVTTGIIDAQPHRMRLRPAPGGISIGHYKVTAGTLGCLATGRTSPRNSRLLLLSNNHVIANSNGGVYGDCICQPGTYDGGRCPADQIAILERFVPIAFGGAVNYVDCATGWCWPDRVRRELMYVSGGAIQYFRINSQPVMPALGMPVGKSGRTTQLTSGRITQIGASINVNYGVGVAFFKDQIAIQAYSGNFSQGGDSGSSVWTWNAYRNPVGLLFAGGGTTTFANPMYRVRAALDINLVT